jgi:hypothetical protein
MATVGCVAKNGSDLFIMTAMINLSRRVRIGLVSHNPAIERQQSEFVNREVGLWHIEFVVALMRYNIFILLIVICEYRSLRVSDITSHN